MTNKALRRRHGGGDGSGRVARPAPATTYRQATAARTRSRPYADNGPACRHTRPACRTHVRFRSARALLRRLVAAYRTDGHRPTDSRFD